MVREDKKRKVAILGWYGHQNFGDELMLKGLSRLFRGWEIVSMSNTDTETVAAVNFEEVNKCDLFVLGGGELIETNRLFIHTPSFCGVRIPRLVHRVMNRTNIFNNISWVHKIRIPKVILGCGVNVAHASELKKEVIAELEQFDYIGLRDQTSVEILKTISTLKNKVHLFYDASFSAVCKKNSSTYHAEKTAVVIPTDRFTYSDRGVQQTHMAFQSKKRLKERLKPYDKAMFLPFGQEDNDDYVTCQLLAECAENSEIISPAKLNFQTVIDYLESSEVVFSYRLHGLILSFILGKRFEYCPYHWKLNRVYETIKDLTPNEIRYKQQKQFELMLRTVNQT